MRIEDTESMSVGSHRRCQHAENGQGCKKLATWGDPARRVRPLSLCNFYFPVNARCICMSLHFSVGFSELGERGPQVPLFCHAHKVPPLHQQLSRGFRKD